MKKIIIFLLFILLTGCSATYELDINSAFSEKINVSGDNQKIYNMYKNSKTLSLYSESQSINYSVDEIETDSIYEIKDLSKQNAFSLQYSYDFDVTNYSDSVAINTCYERINVITKDNIVSIITNDKFNCFEIYPELESVEVIINSRFEVTQSNSDSVKGNKYIWNITKENSNKKPIIFQYDKSKKKKTILDYITGNIYLVGICVGILAVGLLFSLFLKKRFNAKNKI